ncbi:pseudouridine synthase [Acetivibrio saccincola]|uniref:pseudouridine synthase n=1 Tax=Acetivibrio saccincola TaxID=1677857 RepID=UPI000A511BD5|nr:pseudouridine synthase [Acetivibrio saccincola]HOA96463.1 pseudouridine synthase [Acetivibrio saccincola]HQD28762.1 pseudouridine synthase [Acetivibrio saccincola]
MKYKKIRLQKYLADCGVASRRKAEELILQGRISVNGTVVTELGTKVDYNDIVCFDGKRLKRKEDKVYILLNKPVGYVTTVKDQFQRPTVIDLVDVPERIFPVGRLDYDTSGLLILTNDGSLTYRLTHPKFKIKKVYRAVIKGIPSKEKIEKFEKGIEIEDYVTAPAKLKIIKSFKNTSTVEITIYEGKNRQVRKMCENIGHPVLELKRVGFGHLSLGDLPEGKWRKLNKNEISKLLE